MNGSLSDKQKILIGAIVGFLISGIGGYYFKDWADRARPTLAVGTVGMQVSGTETPAELIDISKKSRWTPDLTVSESELENFANLTKLEQDLSRIIPALEVAIANSKQFVLKYSAADGALPREVLLQSPILAEETSDITLPAIIGALRGNGSEALPALSSDGLEVDVAQTDSGLFIDVDATRRLTISYWGSDKNLDYAILILASIDNGDATNLVRLHSYFANEQEDELVLLKSLRAKLREVVLSSSSLQISASIVNEGKNAITIQPGFFARIEFDSDGIDLLLDYRGASVDPNSERVSGFERRYLPRAFLREFITVPGGSSANLLLNARGTLGNRSERVVHAFEEGELWVRLAALSSEGATLISERRRFGRLPIEPRLDPETNALFRRIFDTQSP